MEDRPPLLLLPNVKPVTVARVLSVWTFLLVRLLESPAPVTEKKTPKHVKKTPPPAAEEHQNQPERDAWPAAPAAVRMLPATMVVPSYTRVPLSVKLAGLIVKFPPVMSYPCWVE